ncbi:molecular chaperone GrpE [Allocatelliglobosispora scoriae]|uniref:Protein GrpE n=1 Tax=Allocatelliglobosispora scoriae TaxID=643052 RepID=A0A841BRN7_9ACTN|nr:nucleotide exchange factor GrpE [Allocatelliglobosispora scoriae]MBB5870904.1 molecular chaperone GrpE [Allocatelliglobosispora scoriae]
MGTPDSSTDSVLPGASGPAEGTGGETAAAETVSSAESVVVEGDIVEGDVVAAAASDDAPAAAEPAAVSEPAAADAAPAPSAATEDDSDGSVLLGMELDLLRGQLDEAQVDIKRVAAEYKNYRERVKRDQAAASEKATADTLVALLPVLDDLDRAREHGDLTGPFGSVAEQLTAIVTKLGLTAFGAKGDPFDPNRHEAVAHLPSADVTEPTCVDVMRRGYLLGERLLRPAMVAVAAPE